MQARESIDRAGRPPKRRAVWLAIGALLSIGLFAWVLRGFEFDRFVVTLRTTDYRPLVLLPLAIAAEQMLRAVKWRQLLHPLGRVGVWRLFGAIMAGYFSNHIVPVRISPLVRAWLAARLEGLSVSAVLATVAIERLIDGVVFLLFVVAAISLVSFPGDAETVETRLLLGVGISLAAFAALIAALAGWRWLVRRRPAVLEAIGDRLPGRLARPVRDFGTLFADGIVLPRQGWRWAVFLGCAVVMKCLAVTHLAIAGAAFDVSLTPAQYLFIMVCLGFLVMLASTLKIVGGFIAGSVFLLEGFGVGPETALAMALIVRGTSFLTVVSVGVLSLWLEGVSIAEVRTQRSASSLPG